MEPRFKVVEGTLDIPGGKSDVVTDRTLAPQRHQGLYMGLYLWRLPPEQTHLLTLP